MNKKKSDRNQREALLRSLLYQSAKGQKPATIESLCESIGVRPSTLAVYVKSLEWSTAVGVTGVEGFKRRNVTRLAIKHYKELRKGEKQT